MGPSWATLGPSWGHLGAILGPSGVHQGVRTGTSHRRMLGMECGRWFPAGVSIRPHSAGERAPCQITNQELSKVLFRWSQPAEAGRPGFVQDFQLGAQIGLKPSKNNCFYGIFAPSANYLDIIHHIKNHIITILGSSWAILGPSWAVLGPSWGDLERSWGHLGAILGAFWAILGPRSGLKTDLQLIYPII